MNDTPSPPPPGGDRPLGDRPHLTGTIDTGLREIVPSDAPETSFALVQQIRFWATERKVAVENLRQSENAREACLRNCSLAQSRGDERGRDAWLMRAAHHARRMHEHAAWIARCDQRADDIRRRLAAPGMATCESSPAVPGITLPLMTAAE